MIIGLDLTLHQEKDKHVKLYPTNWLQIIFSQGREHWVVATSIGCEIEIVKVHDSLFNKLDEESKHSSLNYLPKNLKINW